MPIALVFALLAAASPAPTTTCSATDAWNLGRAGGNAVAACSSEDYLQAHRLGQALYELRTERVRIDAALPSLGAAEQGPQRRRQRQIDTDVEAILGVATIKGWPFEQRLPTGQLPDDEPQAGNGDEEHQLPRGAAGDGE